LVDKPMKSFMDVEEIQSFLQSTKIDSVRVKDVIQKSLDKNRLQLDEVAVLLQANSPEFIDQIKEGAKKLKERIYGKRIVLFAPLYIGNKCVNNCTYCGFRASNKDTVRKTLDDNELINEVKALEDNGQKRLILVYGEHPDYDANYIANTVRKVYGVKKGNGEIRRVNVNAAPLDIEGFRKIKEAGIGTFQVFQETYHPLVYKTYHPSGKKSDYNYRLTALDRAQEAGLDDVGIGALFGLYDWKFEVMSLVRHTNHLEACYSIGPHTISFPRLQDALDTKYNNQYMVNDEDFARLIAVLRLAVPYTGLILTARENGWLRDELLSFGVSQIDGGTKIELGAYNETQKNEQKLSREQFKINDDRSLNEIIEELLDKDYIPSFCTSCYRQGRTGEHFMEFSVPGFIKRFCTPNAILTLAEYLVDYAPVETAQKGWQVIENNMKELGKNEAEIRSRLKKIKEGKRDLYF